MDASERYDTLNRPLISRKAIKDVIAYFAEANGVTPQDIVGSSRDRGLVRVRIQIALRLDSFGISAWEIARHLNRDNTTVSYYLGRIHNKPSPVTEAIRREQQCAT